MRQHIAMSYVAGKTSSAGRQRFQAWLDEIETEIKKAKRAELAWPAPRGPLDLVEALRAAGVAEALLDAGGPGLADAMQYLLVFVASCAEEPLIAFWERVMPPRHAFGKRDTTAPIRAQLGGMALRALSARGSAEARAAMIRVLPAIGGSDRGTLVLQGTLTDAALRRSEHWITTARHMAVEDPEFEARYLARCALRACGERVQDEPAGAYAFTLRYRDFSCVIEIASESRLDALHHAVQNALDWDRDHLWCFYLNGRRDQRFVWPSEEWAYQWYEPLVRAEDIADVDPDLPRPDRIGEIGLRAGNQMLYHFDFGANHRVPLKVRRVGDARARRLPAITAAKGKRPRQYDG